MLRRRRVTPDRLVPRTPLFRLAPGTDPLPCPHRYLPCGSSAPSQEQPPRQPRLRPLRRLSGVSLVQWRFCGHVGNYIKKMVTLEQICPNPCHLSPYVSLSPWYCPSSRYRVFACSLMGLPNSSAMSPMLIPRTHFASISRPWSTAGLLIHCRAVPTRREAAQLTRPPFHTGRGGEPLLRQRGDASYGLRAACLRASAAP